MAQWKYSLHIFNLRRYGTRFMGSQLKARPLYPRRKSSLHPFYWWVDTTASMDDLKKRKTHHPCQELEHPFLGFTARRVVTTLT